MKRTSGLKFFALLLALTLMLTGMAACGGNKNKDSASSGGAYSSAPAGGDTNSDPAVDDPSASEPAGSEPAESEPGDELSGGDEPGYDEPAGTPSATPQNKPSASTSSKPSGTASSKPSGTGSSAPSGGTQSSGPSGTSSKVPDVTVTETKEIPYDPGKNPLQRGVNLSIMEGTNVVGYDNWLLQGTTYDAIRDKGFDHVRLPVDFFKHMDNTAPYTIDPEFLGKVDMAVNTALSAGLKIVLDFHHFGDLQVNVGKNKAQFYAMWEQLAEHYQSYPSGLIFELFNEPGNASAQAQPGLDKMTPAKLLELQEEAIKRIRKTNPTRLIVHATQWNNGALQLNSTPLPDDDYIIMAVHLYEPMAFTHQGANWEANVPARPGNVMFEDAMTDEERANLELSFSAIQNYINKTGRAVWIGEFGAMYSKTPEGERAKYAKYMVENMNRIGAGWCWWEFNSGFGLYNPATGAWRDDGVVDALLGAQ